ncbi:hypothetical protein C8Q76DRAFT_200498 [Earliella scabrosa]|nr:hypothetical protein C8Q76DRAFT_200498 [Earliella scabrosa]
MTLAANRAMLCDDIVAEVFSHLRTDSKWLNSCSGLADSWVADLQRTLAASARVSRTFSKFALTELWRSPKDVVALLKVLPWMVKDGTLRLTPDIDNASWTRFCMYAGLINDLSSEVGLCRVDDSVWAILAMRLAGKPLLPRLRELKIVVDMSSPSMPSLLLTPSLESLHVEVKDMGPKPHPDVFQRVMLYGTLAVSGAITSMASGLAPIWSLLGARREAISHIAAMGHLDNLRSIATHQMLILSHKTLIDLSKVARLVHLDVALAFDTNVYNIKFNFARSFQLLGYLKLRGDTQTLALALATMSLPELRTLHLDIVHFEVVAVQDVVRAAARAVSCSTLRSLDIGAVCLDGAGEGIPLSGLLAPFFRPRFDQLRDLSVRLPSSWLVVDDQDLLAFAEAWPQLFHIRLHVVAHDSSPPSSCRPTVLGVALMAQRASNLEEVSLALIGVPVGSTKDSSVAAPTVVPNSQTPAPSESSTANTPSTSPAPALEGKRVNRVRQLDFNLVFLDGDTDSAKVWNFTRPVTEKDIRQVARTVDPLFPMLDTGEVDRIRTLMGEARMGVDGKDMPVWFEVLRVVGEMRAGRQEDSK